jgi:hypothetical protein
MRERWQTKKSEPAPVGAPLEKTKVCASCGRSFAWRKAWARSWSQVKYCSAGCRRHPPKKDDQALEQAILQLLQARGRDKTVCPSEASRAVFGATPGLRPEAMQRSRCAARRLVDAGHIVITQGGKVVDPATARGPIRLRLCEGSRNFRGPADA